MRNRWLAVGAAAIAAAVVVGTTVTVRAQDGEGSDGAAGVDVPVWRDVDGLGRGDAGGGVPVWYDADGLHRGDVVEQTPVDIVVPEQVVSEGGAIPVQGALALVRSGAVYADPATGDVWFHPWGDEPRIVGHDSEVGPGGDPSGDTAVWFEGSDGFGGPGELVVYDTAAGREVSRTLSKAGASVLVGDHHPPGNSFLQVSAERVVWYGGADRARVFSHDLRSGKTVMLRDFPLDVHNDMDVVGWPGSGTDWTLRVPGRPEQRYPGLEPRARVSPSGNYVLVVEGTDERHAAAVVEAMTGELWQVPKNAYPCIAWSYGDIAMIDTDDELLACDAAHRACGRVPAKRPFLMPTN